MKFTLDETKKRYRATLAAMESSTFNRVADSWEAAPLNLFFDDRERGILSVRDTLISMLMETGRKVDHETIKDLFESVTLDQTAGTTARNIHLTYTASVSVG
jgi:hypothetical protein